MEKKTNVAKENHNREDQHFSESWYKDGGRIPPKLSPIRIVGSMQQDAREEIYKEYKKSERKKWLRLLGWFTFYVVACYSLIELVLAIPPPPVSP